MAIERYGSKTDVVVKLVLVFFVCLLSFSVGTYVGKKFSDNQHKLAQFEPTTKERDVASVSGSHGETGKSSDSLTDDEIAKLAEEFVSDEESLTSASAHNTLGEKNLDDKQMDKTSGTIGSEKSGMEKKSLNDKNLHGEMTNTQAASMAKAAEAFAMSKPANSAEVTGSQVKNIERKIAEASKGIGGGDVKRPVLSATTPPADAAKKPLATSLPQELAASTIGKFTVQIASYTTEQEAKKMADSLREQDFSAFYVSADIKDAKTNTSKTYYRVSVGLFETAKEADAYKNDLLSRSKVKSAIVQKISR